MDPTVIGVIAFILFSIVIIVTYSSSSEETLKKEKKDSSKKKNGYNTNTESPFIRRYNPRL